MSHLTPWEKDISGRLKSHQATPPAMGWEKLCRRMAEEPPAAPPAGKPSGSKPAKFKRMRHAFIATALTAAASVALALLFKPTASEMPIPAPPTAQTSGTLPTAGKAKDGIAHVHQTAYSPQDRPSACVKTNGNGNTKDFSATRHSDFFIGDTASPVSPVESAPTPPHEPSGEEAETTEKTHNIQEEMKKAIPFKTTSDNEEQLRHKLFDNARQSGQPSAAKRHTARRLSFSVHSATPQKDSKQKDGYANPNLLPDATPAIASIDYTSGDMNAILANNILSEVNTHVCHHTPLQLGLSVAYALDGRWSISTGLAYTRLTTDIESGSERSYYLTSQELHYIGLPVAVRFTAFSSRYFDAYASVGGMVEKCVGGEQTITYQMSESRKSSNGTAGHVGRGLWQASLNASAGAQLNILPSLGIFFEPGVTWYADDHSSLPNIRHDKPWQFTMQGGLRLTIGK